MRGTGGARYPLCVGCAVPPTAAPAPRNPSRKDGAEVGTQAMARLGPPHGVRAVPAVGSRGAAPSHESRASPRPGLAGSREQTSSGRSGRAKLPGKEGPQAGRAPGQILPPRCSGTSRKPQPTIPHSSPCLSFPRVLLRDPRALLSHPLSPISWSRTESPPKRGPKFKQATTSSAAGGGDSKATNVPSCATGGAPHVPCRSGVKSQARLALSGAKSSRSGAGGPRGRQRPEATCRPRHPWDAPGSSRAPARPLLPCPARGAQPLPPAPLLGWVIINLLTSCAML